MINNSLLLIIVPLSYAGYNLFIKLSGSHNINNSNGIAATLCFINIYLKSHFRFALYSSSIGESIFVLPSKTYLYEIFGGISIGVAEI